MARGNACELRIEDPSSGDLFAKCPVSLGERTVAVEPVADSSRYFVVRLVDETSGRHAFVGMGFADRNDAFDFNVALSDHEKHARRDEEAQAASSSGAITELSAQSSDSTALHPKQDLSLKEGETIRIEVKRPGGGSGFLSRLEAGSGGSPFQGLSPPLQMGGPSTGARPLPSLGMQQPSHSGVPPLEGSKAAPSAGTDEWATF